MTPDIIQLGLLALAWFAYFTIHTLLASIGAKNWVADHHPRWMPAYRMGFNLLAIALLLIPLGLLKSIPGAPLWQWQGYEKWLADGLRVAVIIGFIWTLKYYDGAELLGLRQLKSREQSVDDQEHFKISPFHRFVRHPWYFFAMVYLWAGSMTPGWLISVMMISLYFIMGSRLEERKLLRYHGEVYAQYRRAVPSLFPLPWRHLSRADAQKLVQQYAAKNLPQT